jgi:hypothetical protein
VAHRPVLRQHLLQKKNQLTGKQLTAKMKVKTKKNGAIIRG